MQIRSVIKLGVVLSVVLFCIGIAFYGFARLSMADKENRVDIFEFVPKDCAGILETDNIDNFMHPNHRNITTSAVPPALPETKLSAG